MPSRPRGVASLRRRGRARVGLAGSLAVAGAHDMESESSFGECARDVVAVVDDLHQAHVALAALADQELMREHSLHQVGPRVSGTSLGVGLDPELLQPGSPAGHSPVSPVSPPVSRLGESGVQASSGSQTQTSGAKRACMAGQRRRPAETSGLRLAWYHATHRRRER